ncbi:hypothetical protein RHMOL_Rhmol08G0090500 [Rhododendron molle]|uniref:Uncharacterized protein n=1 Tax=Rhododendron molle TaxID=49168 RepID=A0ACC0MMJ3_RHOML|nr:hypothetical protein RHMOL_Rhmol08G0090500 [Rhododendron molle]
MVLLLHLPVSLSSLLPSNTIPPPSSLKLRSDHHHQRLLHHRQPSRDTSSTSATPRLISVQLTWLPLLRTPIHWTIPRFQCRPQQFKGTHQYEDGGINAMTQSLSDYFTKP